MFVYAAEVAATVRDSARYGIDATLDKVRWPDIRDRIFGRIDAIAAGGREYRAHGPNTTLFEAEARFSGAAHPGACRPARRSRPTGSCSPPARARSRPAR